MSAQPLRRSKPGPAPMARGPVLEVAAQVFAERGFAGTSVAVIADRAGTSKPTIYKHFGDKAALYQSCLDAEVAFARHFLFDAYARAESDSVADEVAADVVAFFDYAHTRPNGFRLLVDPSYSPPGTAAAQAFAESVTARIVQRLAARTGFAVDSPNLRQIGAMLVGASVYAAREALLVSHADPAQASALAAEFMSGAILRLSDRHDGNR